MNLGRSIKRKRLEDALMIFRTVFFSGNEAIQVFNVWICAHRHVYML